MRGRTVQGSAVSQAERVVTNYISNGITIPTPIFTLGIGLVIGIVLGDAMMTSTEMGRRRLAQIAAERIGGKK